MVAYILGEKAAAILSVQPPYLGAGANRKSLCFALAICPTRSDAPDWGKGHSAPAPGRRGRAPGGAVDDFVLARRRNLRAARTNEADDFASAAGLHPK
jgi:hypothetical protein